MYLGRSCKGENDGIKKIAACAHYRSWGDDCAAYLAVEWHGVLGDIVWHYNHSGVGYCHAAAVFSAYEADLFGVLCGQHGLCGGLGAHDVIKNDAVFWLRHFLWALWTKKKTTYSFCCKWSSASGGIRTHTGVTPTDFESVTSASSITLACRRYLIIIHRFAANVKH